MTNEIKRRDFIKTSVAAAGAGAVAGKVSGAPAVGNVQGANDRVRDSPARLLV